MPAKAPVSRFSKVLRVLMSVLTAILIFLFLDIMSVVSDIQGTARVVNYAGLVRGTTQRIVKLEDAGKPQDELLVKVNSYIDGLRNGSEDLNLVRLNDDEFQSKMIELADYYDDLVREIYLVRDNGFENTQIIHKSEQFFSICDKATSLAEDYSQQRATALNRLETVVIVDIAFLVILLCVELARALRTAALNRALQKKVYLDDATGLPNKNKCEELLSRPDPIPDEEPVALCVFDLNNLRTINNNQGHDKGDEYIRSFALQLAKVQDDGCFVGRDGGDEFIAVISDATTEIVTALFAAVKTHAEAYSLTKPDMPISYAAGYALSSDHEQVTMRGLFRLADKNMYLDKNRAKTEEAAKRHRQDQRILGYTDSLGSYLTDCLYCDALLAQYRTIRTSSRMFLAESGSYDGAVEQIAQECRTKDGEGKLRELLALDNVTEALKDEGSRIEALYMRDDRYGKLLVLPLDFDGNRLHHFLLGFKPYEGTSANGSGQLTLYYDQMRQQLLENDNFADALLESAQAAYSVDLTHDRLEKVISNLPSNRYELGIEPPCSYDAYCERRSRYITEETLESFKLVDRSSKLAERFEAGNKQVTVEYQELAKDGTTIWLQKSVLMTRGTSYDLETGAETPVIKGIILFADTSAFHAQEQQEKRRLERALQSADEESRAKTEFMNRMSHDFRTPINGIMGMLDIIRANQDDRNKVRDCLRKIEISSSHLLDLVNDVLEMSKLQSGAVTLEKESFDIEELMRDVKSLVDAQLLETGITHRSHRENMTHTHLIGSSLRVRQVLLNLFSNAIKYNKADGSIDTYSREISCEGGKVCYEFKIADTGIGMSGDFVENHLFSPFTQEDFGARTQYTGTGLGMSIVKSLVEMMGGTIAVESKKNEGTTVTVRLTFDLDTVERPVPKEAVPAESHVLSGKCVLVAEDNDINMEIARFYLETAGADVVEARDGEQALEIFEKSEPESIHIVLMDLMMPVMDGLAATRAIRKLDRPDAKTVPIIAMTANAFDEDREKTKAAGMNDHLVKPLSMQDLAGTLSRFV